MTIRSLYPSIAPTLNLDFAATKRLDPRVTFSRASTATFTGADGLIQTAASGVPRFDHNPTTGESLGLLVEEARTNLITYSEQFDNAAWINSGRSTQMPNTIISPDGTISADSCIVTGTGFNGNVAQSVSLTIGTTYTLTLYLKYKGFQFVRAGFGIGADFASFDLQSGLVAYTGSNVTTASISTFANGWYRCTVRYVAPSTGTYSVQFFPVDIASNTYTTVSGTNGIYVWGAQLEAGAFPTSYIPTVASTVTRAADVASITGTNFSSWYRQDEGTLLSSSRRIASNSNSYAVIGGSNPNVTSSIGLYLISNGNVSAGSSGGGSIVEGSSGTGLKKYAGAYATNNFGASINGSVNATDTSNTTAICDRFYFGGIFPTNEVNAVYSRLTYWPQRLSDTTLQSITR